MYLQLPQLLRRRLVVQVNNWIQKPSRSVTSSSKGGKKMPSSQEGQTKFYPCIWKNDFDNLLQHQKDKDVLGSEISDLRWSEGYSVGNGKHCWKKQQPEPKRLNQNMMIASRTQTSKQGLLWMNQSTKSCEWNIQKGSGKVDRWQLRVEERSGSTAPDTPLIRYRLGRSGKKGTELLSQVERLSQKLSS